MPRNSQQFARTAGPLLKLVQKKLGVMGFLGLAAAAVIYLVVVQPWMAARFGVSLPTLADVVDPPAEKRAPTAPPRATPPRTTQPDATGQPHAKGPPDATGKSQQPADGFDLSEVLTEVGRDAYRSTAGLRYTRGSQHGTRLAHLMSHTRDEPNRDGPHGVFDSDNPVTVVRLVDEAYLKARAGDHVTADREGDQTVYEIDMGRRIGYVGGESGARRGKPPARHLRLVVQGDRLITAFPIRL
jgi:hypothetical protein